ncbi:MAG: adenylate/guanylate cyclase domain-containing protein [Deltaproteobacteria bacterium]|nr:adenylate/guanylate cyclase domain-containing protein [Deltaproteobacteria bacterium]
MSTHEDDLLKGSEARLWRLVAARTQPGADTKAIDERIWDLFGDDWAVMFTDLSGFSRQVARFGIIHFLQVIYEQKRLLLPIVADHDGILIKTEADSFLILFKRAKGALECAVVLQRACRQMNERRLPEEQVLLCLGIGYGRILRIGDVDVFGAEVNAASKLGEDTAKANEILMTGAAMSAAGNIPGLRYEDLGLAVPGSDHNYRVLY